MSMAYPWASPDVISGMSLSQLLMYLGKAKGDGVPSMAFRSRAERQAYADKVRARKGRD